MERRIRAAVCDDSPQELLNIVQRTEEIAAQEGLSIQLDRYESAEALLGAVRAGKKYQLLLLDVMMDGMNGMELAAALRASRDEGSIIFISSNREMAMQGYEVAAARYLAKPLETEKLREALLFCCREQAGIREIMLPASKGMRRFRLDEIVCAETWGRCVRITLNDGQQEEISLKISELEEMLPEDRFVLCHRAYLVNMAAVRYIRYRELELKTGLVLPVSKYRQNETRAKLLSYLED